jgi:hypothetical protein
MNTNNELRCQNNSVKLNSTEIKFKNVDCELIKTLEKMIYNITIEDYNKCTDTIKFETVDIDLLKSLEILMLNMINKK